MSEASDGGSAGRTAAATPPERVVESRSKRHAGFASMLGPPARGLLRSFAALRHSVVLRLLGAIVLFSACVTLILTLLQLYIDYRRDVSAIELGLEQVRESYLDSLAEGLWTLDEKQLRLQLNGILRLPDIRAVETREAGTAGNPFVVKLGEKSESPAIAREYPLHHNVQGQDRVIGTVYVEATLADVYRRLVDRALTVFAGKAAEAFLVSLFILYILYYLVTRHLSAIAAYVGSYRINDSPSELRLRRRPPRHEDELQRVVTAFNTLSHNLHISHRDLAEREAKIRRLVEANVVGIFIWDFDGQIFEANDAFLRIVGYEREDLLAGRLRWTDMTPPDWRERDAQWVEEHKRTGLRQPIEKEFFRKDGSRVPILLGAATFEEGGNQGVGFVLDLTERKRAEAALRESEERFRTLVQFSFDVYWESDAQHRFIRQEFAEGLADAPAPGSEIGKTRWEVPYLEPDEEAWRKHRETLDTHLPFRDFEYARPTLDGGKRYVSVSGLPVFDEKGRFVGYRGVARYITERKRAEEALRDSEEQWKAVFENNPTMYFMVDVAGTIRSVNPFGAEQLGYSADELVGRPVQNLFHEADRELVQRNAATCLAQLGQTQSWEARKVRKGGAVLWVRETARAMLIKKQPILLIACEDITEQKHAEEAARRSERELAAAIDAIPAMVWIAWPDGHADFFNRRWQEYTGLTLEQSLGWEWGATVHPEDTEQYFGKWRECIASGQPIETEVRFRRAADGEYRWFLDSGAPLRDEQGNILKWYGVVTDIDDRKQAEYLTGQVFESSPDGVAVVGRDYRYRRVNPVYERLWRVPAERIVGMHVADLLGTEVFEQTVKPKLDRCFAGEEVRYTNWFVDARGRRYVAVSYTPLRLDSKAVEAALVISHDLTEHELAAEALREAQMKLAHVNRVTTMGQLTAAIAHEVNQPIAAAVTNAQAALRWLAAHPPDLDEARRALDRIDRDGNRASEVVTRIRNLVRKGPPQRDQVDLNETILVVVALTRREAERHRVVLQTRLAHDLPPVWGDRIQLQQVILNLIMNAIEAMSGCAQGPRELLVGSGRDDADGVCVTVRDSGPGLDPNALDRLFEAFHTTKPDGIGMGLAISRSIVEAHGGRLWATPNAPGGAVFQFTLPLEAGQASSAQDTQAAAQRCD